MSNITDKTRRLLANPRYNILKLWIQCQFPDPRANLISGKCKFLGDGNKMWIIYTTMEVQSTGGLLCTSERKEHISALEGLAKVHIKVLTEN